MSTAATNTAARTEQPVKIMLYRWAGQWGPFKVKIPCGECALTADVLKDVLENELSGIPVTLETKDWLSNWGTPLKKGGWHAPIVMVEGRVVSQGEALNRGVITQAVINAHAKTAGIGGTHVFGKDKCPHCVRAKAYLDEVGMAYTYHDVVREPRALYEMLARVKPIVGPKTPITVPQIWIDGRYIGGADELGRTLGLTHVEPNSERGANSLAPAAWSTKSAAVAA
ncbi:MAG: glutaredoxin [Pseudomonadota bacterium]